MKAEDAVPQPPAAEEASPSVPADAPGLDGASPAAGVPKMLSWAQFPDVDIRQLPQQTEGQPPRIARQLSEEGNASATAWNIDGSRGHYHHVPSLCLVLWAQIIYIVSLVIIIPTAGDYAAKLGTESATFFGFLIGISSVIDPIVTRLWTSVIKATSLDTVFLINAAINLGCTLLYVLAGALPAGGDVVLMISRCMLGLGSVQTAKLQYLGCAVSRPKVTFAHFLTSAIIAYGFAFGAFLAFFLSMVCSYRGWDQNTAPGWFSALLWLTYIPLHRLLFVEPDVNAGVVDPGCQVRLNKEMRPRRRREPLGGLTACYVAIFVIAVVKGAFEVLTIEVSKDLWKWSVMESALFLGAVMLIVALTTLLSQGLQNKVGATTIFFIGMLGATLLLPFYYIPVNVRFERRMGSNLGMLIYLLVSVVALSLLNLGRTLAFSLTTELPSPHWRGYFLSIASQCFTMGRGVGPILAGVVATHDRTVTSLVILSGMATAYLALAWRAGKLHPAEHEVGPARADTGDHYDDDSWAAQIDSWFSWANVGMTMPNWAAAPQPQASETAAACRKDPDASHPTLALGAARGKMVTVVGKPVPWEGPAAQGVPQAAEGGAVQGPGDLESGEVCASVRPGGNPFEP